MYIIKRILNTLNFLSNFSPLALVWMIKASTFGYAAKRIAFKKLPEVGAKLGLKHKQGTYISDFGELKGIINKHEVTVEPEESKIEIYFKHTYNNLYISLAKPYSHLEKYEVDFITKDWKFNSTFRTKRVNKKYSSIISENRELIYLLNKFYCKWMFRLETFIISDTSLYCELKYGYHFNKYLPSSKLETLIKELIVIVDKVDDIYYSTQNN